MGRSPTMADIAAAAGVSPMTVSRAFRQHERVHEATRARIFEAADALGYVFDSTASTLRSQRTGFVAVTIPSINNANFADTVGAMTEGLAAHGLQILLGYTDYDMAREERLIAQLLRRRPEAIVVTGGRHTPGARRLLANAAVPVVEIWDLPEAPLGHVVGFSNAATMHAMVDHLVAQGMRRIAFIGGDASGDIRGTDRRRGFVEALRRHGLDDTRQITAGIPPISMWGGATAMADLLTRFADTQAVVCVSDLSAFGALTECQRRSVAVPGDIAVAGFGAFDIAAFSVPSITTIDARSAEIGSETAVLVARLLKDPGTPLAPETIRVAPSLIPGGSTAPAADG